MDSKNKFSKLCSVEKIPLKNHSVDIVICSEVLQYITDYIKVVKEIKRILRPGGLILLTVPNVNYPFFRHPFLRKNSKRPLKFLGDIKRYFNEKMILNKFQNKYKLIKKVYIGHEIVSFLYPNYLIALINKYLIPKELVSGYLSPKAEHATPKKPKTIYNLKVILSPFFLISKLIYYLDACIMGRSKKSINILFKIKKLQ